MTRNEFKQVVTNALESVTLAAEQRLSRKLPRLYSLAWLGGPTPDPGDDVVELLTAKVFISEEQIYPCVDVFLDTMLPDGRLLVVCYRAGYPPGPYGEHWQYRTGGHDSGQVGPFKLGCNKLVVQMST